MVKIVNDIENTIYEIMAYINLNLFEHITLDTLSYKFSYSKFHLHRRFKEVIGITLNEYIKKRRIENSIYFLFANPDTAISEIAGYCGFSSATYSREFKKIFSRTPKEWRNIYKKGIDLRKDSNICKNYKQFIDYNDNGIPREIKEISLVDIEQKNLSARIFYGNYYDKKINTVWEEVKKHNKGNRLYILISMNSPAVTDLNSCLFLIGFESDSKIAGLSNITLDSGNYVKIDYHGLREKFREVYTWIIKYYLPGKGLKYDYRVQFLEYVNIPDFTQNEVACKIYLPIIYA